jgi:CheY-like chemotaxis protein
VEVAWPSTAAIIDDSSIAAMSTSVAVEDAGFVPIVLQDGFATLDDAVTTIRHRADSAVCDHRLSFGNYAQFSGAELVARLYDEGTPAILVTQYVMDADVSIRQFRRQIPVVLLRPQIEPSTVRAALARCVAEVGGQYGRERLPIRTLVRVLNRSDEGGQSVIDALVPAWRTDEAVRFPLSLIREDLRPEAVPDARFFAEVNVGADANQDLFFANFERVPTTSSDDAFSNLIDP